MRRLVAGTVGLVAVFGAFAVCPEGIVCPEGAVHRAHAASDPALKCRQAVVRGAAKLAHARAVALRKCEDARHAGKSGVVVCAAAADVVQARVQAEARLAAAVDRACGGADKRCGDGDDVTLAAMRWPSTCPALEGSCSGMPLASCADVPACVDCLADAAMSRATALVYAPLAFVDPKTEKTIIGCQKAIASAAAKLGDAHLAVDAACLAGRLAGKVDGACPLPGDGRAAANLAAVRAAAEAKVCRACGGADKRCGGEEDLRLDFVGVPPACPAVGTCAPTIASMADLVDCVDCAAGVRDHCALAAAAPGVADYPPACAIVPPTPTATSTPTPTATPVASPTESATPPATPTPVFCVPESAGKATTTVTITLSSGETSLGGAEIVLGYAPHLVRLPGAGDDPAVRARVVDLTAGQILNKGAPNNQDGNGDREPDRVRFTLVSVEGVTGDVLKVTFDRCQAARLTTTDDYTCTVADAVGVDAVTPVATLCTLALAQGAP